jgi:hypothetical protein
MGVEYERWLVAKGKMFAPGAEAVAKLVAKLRKEGFIVDPASPDLAKLRFQGKRQELAKKTGGYAVKTVANTFGSDVVAKLAAGTEPLPAEITPEWLDDPDREELRLVWPVMGKRPLPVKYPLSIEPEGDEPYWALEVHRSPEYVYPISENIDPLPTTCACGEDLGFEWDLDDLVPAFGAATGIFAECEECSRTFDPFKGTATLTNPFDGSTEERAGGGAYLFALKVDCGKCFAESPRLTFAKELVALVEEHFGRAFCEYGSAF